MEAIVAFYLRPVYNMQYIVPILPPKLNRILEENYPKLYVSHFIDQSGKRTAMTYFNN